MANLAIKGHPTRGREVIQLLEMLGGTIKGEIMGNDQFHGYYINSNGNIDYKHYSYFDDAIPFTLEEFLEKFPYKVGDKVSSKYLKNCIIEKAEWESCINRVIYKLKGLGWYSAEELQSYKEKNMGAKETLVQIDLTRKINVNDEIEVILGDYEFVLKDGKTYFVKKKPQYPKTYKECCGVLGMVEDLQFVYEDIDDRYINPACISTYSARRLNLYNNFEKLSICRDAYWKIYGEQIGLGESWEPDWEDENQIKYIIGSWLGTIQCLDENFVSHPLAFPNEEMRDAFYENFKGLIHKCKELL